MRTTFSISVTLLLLVGSRLVADGAMSQAALQPLVSAAVTAGAGNSEKAIDVLDRAVKAQWGDFEKGPLLLVPYSELARTGAIAMPPYLMYRDALKTKLRQLEPIESLAFVDEVTIEILPQRVDAMDIIKVVLTRDGQMVAPLRNELAPRAFSNRLGGTAILHAGNVVFPTTAFARGATVQITLIPEVGKNVTTTVDDKRLAKFR